MNQVQITQAKDLFSKDTIQVFFDGELVGQYTDHYLTTGDLYYKAQLGSGMIKICSSIELVVTWFKENWQSKHIIKQETNPDQISLFKNKNMKIFILQLANQEKPFYYRTLKALVDHKGADLGTSLSTLQKHNFKTADFKTAVCTISRGEVFNGKQVFQFKEKLKLLKSQ